MVEWWMLNRCWKIHLNWNRNKYLSVIQWGIGDRYSHSSANGIRNFSIWPKVLTMPVVNKINSSHHCPSPRASPKGAGGGGNRALCALSVCAHSKACMKQIRFCLFAWGVRCSLVFLLTARVSPEIPTAINLNYTSHVLSIDFRSPCANFGSSFSALCLCCFSVALCHSAPSKHPRNGDAVKWHMHNRQYRFHLRAQTHTLCSHTFFCQLDVDQQRPQRQRQLLYTS